MGNPKGTPENLVYWEEGKCPNPNGRPKGVRNRSTIYKEIVDALVTETKMPGVKELAAKLGVTDKRITIADLIALKNTAIALRGDALGLKATEHVEDSVFGKMVQKQEVTGADGEALLKDQVAEQFKNLSIDQIKKIQAIIGEKK